MNKDDGFASFCTGLIALPGLGPLYQKLTRWWYGPTYIKDLAFRDQLDICYRHNPELTTALIKTREGTQVILETCTGMPGSVFEELATDIDRCDEHVRYSYYKALASQDQGRAAAQIQAVRDAGGNVPEQTFPLVRRQEKRTGETGTFQCGFLGCTSKPFSKFANLERHVKLAKQEHGRTGTARPATHVGYTPDPKDFEAEREATAGDPKKKKVWGTGSK